MADRGSHRGARGAHRGSGGRGGRGAHGGERGGHAHAHAHGGDREKPKKENILDLNRFMDKSVCVTFSGGREVTGTLKGFDALMNLVLDDVSETMRDEENNTTTRPLGLVVARGTLLVQLSPVDGSEVIANPFLEAAED